MNQELFRLLFKRKKKSLREFKRLCGIFCYFSSEQKCWQGKRWNYISYSWSGTRPQAKKGNVLLNVTYWKDGEQRGCEREEGREGEQKEKETEGVKEGDNGMLMKSKNDSEWSNEESLKEETKTRSLLNFKIAAVVFITNREVVLRLSIIRHDCTEKAGRSNVSPSENRGLDFFRQVNVYSTCGNVQLFY